MASTLLNKLNQLANKTPDEIVAQLHNNGWRLPSELGEAYFNANREVSHVYCQVLRGGQRGTVGGRRGDSWCFRSCVGEWGSYSDFVNRLETNGYQGHIYWIIPQTDFKEGEYPPCSTS